MLVDIINQKTKLLNINLLLFLFINIFDTYYCNINCKNNPSLSNKDCFNNILLFNEKKYRAGQFATNKKGDLIIEFSEDDGGNNKARLLYGLKRDGRYFFQNEEAIYEFTITGAQQNGIGNYYYARYESRNIFISMDNNDDNEYLFSVSSYSSVVELHKLNDDYINHLTWIPKDFFNFEEEHIHSYEFSLYEIKNNRTYIIVFLPKQPNTDSDKADSYIIKKFNFTSFNESGFSIIVSTKVTDSFNNRIISSFSMDDYNILVVFYVKKTRTVDQKDYGKYCINFYDYDLNSQNEFELTEELGNLASGDGIFFKAFYLKEKYGAFIFFKEENNGNSLNFKIMELSIEGTNYKFNDKINYVIDVINFNTAVSLSDFLKIDEKRIVFISSQGNNQNVDRTVHFLLFDLYNNYTYMKIRIYNYNINDYIFQKELTGFIYNGYLLFDSTCVLKKEGMNDGDWINFFSIFMIIGYSNGTDSTIDISSFFSNSDNFDIDINFTSFLYDNLTIDNNIFGYIPDNQIKLVSIPKEI